MIKAESWIRKLFDQKGGPMIAASVCLLFLLESRYALRKRSIARINRLKTNLATASIAAVGLRLALIPGIVQASIFAERKKWGFLRFLHLPPLFHHLLCFLLLDYGNYRWHKLNHSSSFLWRFHQVHHADLDLDVSTALRFHIGEILASILYRGAWVIGTGASPLTVLVYEIIFETATNFHHSNLRLPERMDKALARFIVTPRMHGIHHSIVREETDSNFCIVFSLWDRLHNTLRLNIPQEEITIGVPYIREHKEVLKLLSLPLAPVPEWKLPNGKIPERIDYTQ